MGAVIPGESPPDGWKVLSLLESTARFFTERGLDSPRLSAELLLGRVLSLERIGLYTNFDRPLDSRELSAYRELVRRRSGGEPLQYILGETGFMGLRFEVNKDVLIPRPETEQLVELVIALEKDHPGALANVLDIGTGSGNIALSIARYLPGCRVDALDVSPEALEVAGRNALALGLGGGRVSFVQGDILDESLALPHGPYDLVVSNPPYISGKEFLTLQTEVREHEPAVATTDRGDGLTFYRAIARRIPTLLAPGRWCVVEVAYDQHEMVAELFGAAGCLDVASSLDYQGIPRFVSARRP